MGRKRVFAYVLATLLTAVVAFAAPKPAGAFHLPTHPTAAVGPYVTHLDLNPDDLVDINPPFPAYPPMVFPVIPPPGTYPAGIFPTGEYVVFLDSLWNYPYAVWHWESEVDNPNRFPVVFRVAFIAPGRFIIGWLGLLPGWTLHIDIHVQDGPPTGPEIGYWTWGAASFLPYSISKDTSVTERQLFLLKHPPQGPDNEDVPFTYELLSPEGKPGVPQELANKVFFVPDVCKIRDLNGSTDGDLRIIRPPDLVFELAPGIHRIPPWRKIEPREIPIFPLRPGNP